MVRCHFSSAPRLALALALALAIAIGLVIAPAGALADGDVAPYVTATQVDLVALLPPPPPAGSAADQAEIAAVAAAQSHASAKRVAMARHDAVETVYAMFGGLMGDKFNAHDLPLTDHLFARLGESETATADPVKAVFHRERPFLAAPQRIKALVKPSHSGSYPSGHSTRVTLEGEVLAAMIPERRSAIWVRIHEYEQSRIVGGMHYPSDIEAGTLAGTAMAAVVFADPQFRKDFEAARTELRSALGVAPRVR